MCVALHTLFGWFANWSEQNATFLYWCGFLAMLLIKYMSHIAFFYQ